MGRILIDNDPFYTKISIDFYTKNNHTRSLFYPLLLSSFQRSANDHSRSTGITITKILLHNSLSSLSNFQLDFSSRVFTNLPLSPRPCLFDFSNVLLLLCTLQPPRPNLFPPSSLLSTGTKIFANLSLSLSRRPKEGKPKEKRNGETVCSVAVVAAERTATRRLVIHRVQVRFYLVTVCTPAETRLPSFQIATNGPTIHIRG